jgi:hypothetical protein
LDVKMKMRASGLVSQVAACATKVCHSGAR